jgi:hypothetical protein
MSSNFKTFCGYIDPGDGILHPCKPECCTPGCDGPPPSTVSEYKLTRGVNLPPGFGQNLPISPDEVGDRATPLKFESPFQLVGPTLEPAYHRRYFWMLFLVALMVLMALFLI